MQKEWQLEMSSVQNTKTQKGEFHVCLLPKDVNDETLGMTNFNFPEDHWLELISLVKRHSLDPSVVPDSELPDWACPDQKVKYRMVVVMPDSGWPEEIDFFLAKNLKPEVDMSSASAFFSQMLRHSEDPLPTKVSDILLKTAKEADKKSNANGRRWLSKAFEEVEKRTSNFPLSKVPSGTELNISYLEKLALASKYFITTQLNFTTRIFNQLFHSPRQTSCNIFP